MIRRGLIWLIVVLGFVVAGGWLFLAKDKLIHATQQPQAGNVVADLQQYVPEPLRWTKDTQGFLTVKGTIDDTNHRRELESLSLLKENSALNRAAEVKLNDMFAHNYFAHESPEGRGPADLVKDAGYDYILVGENLALGNFANDIELVQAWMDSPGHRANILKKNYSEIGVAVGEGMFDGKKTWLAVQEFGRPASACAEVNHSLQLLLDANKNESQRIEAELKAKQQEIANTTKNSPAYNQKVGEYNRLVEQYNELSARSKKLAEQYNADVDRYNYCLHNATS